MSDGVTAEWTGLDGIIRGFGRAAKATPAERQASLMQAVEDAGTVDLARQLAPRHPGGPSHGTVHGADVITLQPEKSAAPGSVAVAIGPTAAGWYLRFAEVGTYKWRGKPFLRPALAATLQTIVRLFAGAEAKRLEGSFR